MPMVTSEKTPELLKPASVLIALFAMSILVVGPVGTLTVIVPPVEVMVFIEPPPVPPPVPVAREDDL